MSAALAVFVMVGLSSVGTDVQPGTRLLLRLESTISTRTAEVGDAVQLRTAGPTTIDGQSIPVGTLARGEVARVQRPGRVRGRAELEIRIVSIARPDGTSIPITASTATFRPPRRRVRPPGVRPPSPTIPILAGMAAGYGTAALMSRATNSVDTVVRSGVVAGLATGVMVGVLKRGEDLIVRPGMIIDVVFQRAGLVD